MIAQDIEASLRFAERPFSETRLSLATQRSYASDLQDFESYCLMNSVRWLPAEPMTVRAYISHLAAVRGLKMTTIKRRLASISQNHRRRGFVSPVNALLVSDTLKGIASDDRFQGCLEKTQKTALTGEMLLRVVGKIDRSTAIGKRDAALMLLMFSGKGLRRSEVAALDLRDITINKDSVRFCVRRSQTDQDGIGHWDVITRNPTAERCAVLALEAWLLQFGAHTGPVFQSFTTQGVLTGKRLDGRDMTRIIKRRAKAAGLKGDFASNSIRRGFVTTAVRRGLPVSAIMKGTRHKAREAFLACVEGPDPFAESSIPDLL